MTNHLTPNSTNGAIQEETDCIDNVNDNNVDQNYNSNKTKSNQVVPLSSDYRLSDTATTLNPQSSLVQGVWWKNCPGGVYPTGDGSANTSIVGGANPGDVSNATNGTGIAAGVASNNDRSVAANSGGNWRWS